ncbi:TPA: hypothetical protein DCG61_00395, partial [Patescibacteria group bacterium]|nr:hypothetical protein [Patescibacteria group bacterium]
MQQIKTNISKKSKLVIALVALAMVAVSCGGSPPQQKVTLKIWKPFVDSENMSVIIQEYRKVNPNVTIEYTKKNIETYEQDLLNAFAAGSGPDI